MSKIKYFILLFLFLLNLFSLITLFHIQREEPFRVFFFDIGQGDAALIRTPQGENILIDGGPDEKILEKIGRELPFWERTIDLVILSHPHHDHLRGLVDVLERYNVRHILTEETKKDSLTFNLWKDLIEGKEKTIAKRGQRITLGEVKIDVLYPKEDHYYFKDPNRNSIVNRVSYKGSSFLFTGDIYSSEESLLLDWKEKCREKEKYWCDNFTLYSQVLKVAHHGSRTSSKEGFVREVSPEVAVISAGEDNHYGHPHKETLDTLYEMDLKVKKTYRDGDIIFKVER